MWGFLTKDNLTLILNNEYPKEFLELFKGKFNFGIKNKGWITITITKIKDAETFQDELLYFTQNYNGPVNIEYYGLYNNDFGKKSLKSLL